MTVEVGRTAAKIPYPYLVGAIIAIISASITVTVKYVTAQDRLEAKIDKLELAIESIQKTTITYIDKTDKNTAAIIVLSPDVANLKTEVNSLKEAANYFVPKYRYVTESRGRNGRIKEHPYSNN